MPKLRTGLYSLDVRLGTLPTFSVGDSPTGPLVAPIAPSGRVLGTGIGSFPLALVYRLRSAADRGGGLALMNRETQDGNALHTLRDQLSRQLRSGLLPSQQDPAVLAASYVKALLDVTVATTNSEARLNEGLAALWPGGMTVVQLRRDLVGGNYGPGGAGPTTPSVTPTPTPTPTYTVPERPTLSSGGGGLLTSGGGGGGGGVISRGGGAGPLDTSGIGPGLPSNVGVEVPPSVSGSSIGSTAPNVPPGPCELLSSWVPRNAQNILHGEEWAMIAMMVPSDTRICKIGDPVPTGDGSILEQWVSFRSPTPIPSTSRGAAMFAAPQRVLLDAHAPALVWGTSIPWLMPALAAVAGVVLGAVIVRVAT